MEYKRLTFRYESVDGTKQVGYTEKLILCFNKQTMILNRLAELEDKIELGTLIEKKTCVYKQAKELDFVWWECSDCGSGFNFYANTPYQNRFHYCPYCGAKIVECKEIQNG